MFFAIGSLALVSAAFYLVVGRRVPGLMRPVAEKETAGVGS